MTMAKVVDFRIMKTNRVLIMQIQRGAENPRTAEAMKTIIYPSIGLLEY